MYQPPVKGIVRKKALPRKVVDLKALEAEKVLKKNISLTEEVVQLKEDVIQTVELGIEHINQTVDQKMDEADEILDNLVERANEVIESMLEMELPEGIPGDPGEPGEDADEEKIKEEVLAELRNTLDKEAIIQELLLRIPPAQVIDEKALLKKLLSKVPENKESLKIIRENIEVDPMAIIQKIMELPAGKFKIKPDQVDGLEQTMSAFRSQLGKGYLHGGGDTVVAGANINITTDNNGRKVISSLTGAVSRTMTYNADGTLNVTTDSYGTRTCVYSSGLLTGINGTGIYPTKTIGYNGSGVVTSITIS